MNTILAASKAQNNYEIILRLNIVKFSKSQTQILNSMILNLV